MSSIKQLHLPVTLVVLAVILGCRQESGSPTAATKTTSLDPAFSEEGSSSDDRAARRGTPYTADIQPTSGVFSHLVGRYRLCPFGGDVFAETDHRFTGTSVGDPRLTGWLEVRLQDFNRQSDFTGVQFGTVTIREGGQQGAIKFKGDYSAWGTGGDDFIQGTVVGTAFGSDGGRMVATYKGIYPFSGGIGIEFGGAPRGSRVPAGIYRGRCPDNVRWVPADEDIPPIGFAAMGSASVSRNRTPLR